jgi:protein TonB
VQPPPQVIAAWSKSTEQSAKASQAELEVWKSLIVDRVERMKVYPPDAHERKEAGVVHLFFSLNRKGEVVSSGIAQSSGHPSLDAAALEIVRKGQPYAPPPTLLKGDEIRLTLPIRFSLLESY